VERQFTDLDTDEAIDLVAELGEHAADLTIARFEQRDLEDG